jgi:hypothetical protein
LVSATRPYRFGDKAVQGYLVVALKLAICRGRLRLRRNGSSFAGRRSRSGPDLTGETILKRQKQGGSFGALQPAEPFNSFMHKGLSTRGNPFFFRFGRSWGQNFAQPPRELPIVFTLNVRVGSECQRRVSASMRQSPHFCNAQLSVICLTDSLVTWKQN